MENMESSTTSKTVQTKQVRPNRPVASGRRLGPGEGDVRVFQGGQVGDAHAARDVRRSLDRTPSERSEMGRGGAWEATECELAISGASKDKDQNDQTPKLAPRSQAPAGSLGPGMWAHRGASPR